MSRPPVISVVNRSRWSKEERKQHELQEDAIKVGNDRMTPPDYLTDRAKQLYNQLAWEMQWLDNLDHADLVLYCFFWDRVQTILARFRDEPDTFAINNKGKMCLLPNDTRYAIKNYTDEMRKISAKIGISHADRLRLLHPQKEEKEENKFSAFKRNRVV